MATIKKAQAGVKLSPQQKRAQMDSITSVRRAEIVRKKDSILDRQAAAKGMTREQQRAQQAVDKKRPNVSLEGLQTSDANKRTKKTGSCTTGETMGGDSLKDNKRNGGNINQNKNIIMKKAQSGTKVSKAKIKQNLKDATTGNGRNSRPIFDKNSPVLPMPGRPGKNMPKSKMGKTIKKGRSGCK